MSSVLYENLGQKRLLRHIKAEQRSLYEYGFYCCVFCISFGCVVLGTRNTPHSREICFISHVNLHMDILSLFSHPESSVHSEALPACSKTCQLCNALCVCWSISSSSPLFLWLVSEIKTLFIISQFIKRTSILYTIRDTARPRAHIWRVHIY